MDFACAPFTGYYSRVVVELAAYIVGDAFGIFVKYPNPKIALDGPIKTFSLYVHFKSLYIFIPFVNYWS